MALIVKKNTIQDILSSLSLIFESGGCWKLNRPEKKGSELQLAATAALGGAGRDAARSGGRLRAQVMQ